MKYCYLLNPLDTKIAIPDTLEYDVFYFIKLLFDCYDFLCYGNRN